MRERLLAMIGTRTTAERMRQLCDTSAASRETERATYQAMEALIHNLNTMHSRAGAQTPFSSINYGMDTSPEGAHGHPQPAAGYRSGLGNGETPIFPIQIFRVKEGVNYNPGDPNYDLFQLACRVSAPSACSRISPSWMRRSTCKYYKPGHPETEIAYMGCRTRVIGNVYDPDARDLQRPRQPELHLDQPAPHCHREQRRHRICSSRTLDEQDGSGLRAAATSALRSRRAKKVRNYPFLMGAGRLDGHREAGLGRRGARGAQARHAVRRLYRPGGDAGGAHRRASRQNAERAQKLGLEIIGHMRERLRYAEPRRRS